MTDPVSASMTTAECETISGAFKRNGSSRDGVFKLIPNNDIFTAKNKHSIRDWGLGAGDWGFFFAIAAY
jgi:hypothetical protein